MTHREQVAHQSTGCVLGENTVTIYRTRNNEHPLTTARLRRALARVYLGGGFCQFHWYRIIVPHCPPRLLAVESGFWGGAPTRFPLLFIHINGYRRFTPQEYRYRGAPPL